MILCSHLFHTEREREMSKMLGALPRVKLTAKRKWNSSGNKHPFSSKYEGRYALDKDKENEGGNENRREKRHRQ